MDNQQAAQFASALSTRTDLNEAINEVCRAALDQLGAEPQLALLFVSSLYSQVDESHVQQAGKLLGSHVALMGGSGESIVGVGQEIEQQPAVSLWLARLPGTHLVPMYLQLEQTAEGASIVGWPDALLSDWPSEALMLLVGDPFSFPADAMLERLNEDRPGTLVVGGMASGGTRPGDSRLFFGSSLHTSGAVAVVLSGACSTTTVLSQGCRPIGHHLVITKVERNVIQELGGKPALLQLKEIFDTLPTSEQELVQRGLHLGRVVNAYQDQFSQGDFLVRNVLQLDPDRGSIVIGDYFRAGQTVQFHIRDHQTADAEMRQLLAAACDESQRDVARRAAVHLQWAGDTAVSRAAS